MTNDKVERAIARFDRIATQLDERDGPVREAARRERQRLNADLGRRAVRVGVAVGLISLVTIVVGFIVPIVVMWILLPWQGGGWGYRYVHPVMGNAVLLGGYGVDMLQRRVGAALERPLVWTSAAAIFLLVPLHGLLVHRLAAPRAAKERIYVALDRDLLISDERVSDDFIHNRPDLSNRPIRLLAPAIKPEQVAALCAGRSMTFLDPAPPVPPSERQQALKAAAIAAGCDARQMHEPST